MSLEKRFVDNFRQQGFYQSDKAVLLAVSGGVDSMVMASLFLKNKMKFAVAHCNFQLRGEDADKDEELVLAWCKQHDVECYHIRFDTQAKVDEWKKGIQETARILRYEWLEGIRAKNNYTFIATAHHANDNAETFLMNMFKGTGMSGLHGIPKQNDKIIRPLLFLTKAELSAYAADNNVPYRNDVSNETDKYLRNAIRLNLLPEIKKLFPVVITTLNENVQRFSEVETIYKKAIEQEKKGLLEHRGKDIYVPVRKLRKKDAIATLCYELFKDYGFTSKQTPHIVDLLSSESGHFIVSDTHRIIRDRDFLIVTTVASHDTDFIKIADMPATIELGEQVIKLSEQDKPKELSTHRNIAYINPDKVEMPLVLRRWRQGDYFYPLGMGMKKKKLSRFFIDQKLPIHEKENVWVLESNKRIVWVVGYRLDERFKVLPTNNKVLLVENLPV